MRKQRASQLQRGSQVNRYQLFDITVAGGIEEALLIAAGGINQHIAARYPGCIDQATTVVCVGQIGANGRDTVGKTVGQSDQHLLLPPTDQQLRAALG